MTERIDDASMPTVQSYAKDHGWHPGLLMNAVEYLDHMVKWYRSHLEEIRKAILDKGLKSSTFDEKSDPPRIVQEVRNILADRQVFLGQRDCRLDPYPFYSHGLINQEELKDPQKATERLLKLSKAVSSEEEYERGRNEVRRMEGQLTELRGELEVARGRNMQIISLLRDARKTASAEVGKAIDAFLKKGRE